MTNRPLLIEFMGVPGGGKSTIAKALADKLFPNIGGIRYLDLGREMRSIRKEGRLSFRKISNAGCFLLTHFKCVVAVLTYVATANPTIMGFKRGLVLLRSMNTIKYLRFVSNDIIIMEEGVLQMIWSVLVDRWYLPNAAIMTILFNIIQEYELIIVNVSIPTEIAVDRIKKRGKGGRFTPLSNKELFDDLEIGKGCFEALGKLSEEVGGRVIKLNGTNEIIENLTIITRYIGFSKME